jgi:ribosomal protein L35
LVEAIGNVSLGHTMHLIRHILEQKNGTQLNMCHHQAKRQASQLNQGTMVSKLDVDNVAKTLQ